MQLLQRQPQLRVRVIERRRHPAPPAAHKVGESTVEIGAHYFAEALGLQEHMETEQLKKFGFRFFFNDCRGDIENCAELGVSHVLPTPTYQIDRGTFETFLGEEARRRGIEFIDGAVVRRIDLSDDGSDHSVEYEHAGARLRVNARWVVDASGRAGLIKRKLDLAEPNDHNVNAVWFRLEGKVDVNDWCDDEAWLEISLRYRPMLIGWATQLNDHTTTFEQCDDIADRAFARAWSALSAERFGQFPNLPALLGYLRACVSATTIDTAIAVPKTPT